MPLKNSEKFLAEVFESLLAQVYTSYKIIISDNCSSDKTEEICRYYADKFPEFLYFRQAKEIEVEEQFKFLFKMIETPFFSWVADDDLYDEDWFEVCMSNVSKNKAAFGRVQYIDQHGKLLYSLANSRVNNYSIKSNFLRQFKFIMSPDFFGEMILFWGVYPSNIVFEEVYAMHKKDRNFGVDKLYVYRFLTKHQICSGLKTVFYKRIHLGSDSAITNVGFSNRKSDLKDYFALFYKRNIPVFSRETRGFLVVSMFIFMYPIYFARCFLFAFAYYFSKSYKAKI